MQERTIDSRIMLSASPFPAAIHLRLRVPEGYRIERVSLNGRQQDNFDAESGTIIIPERSKGNLEIHVQY